MLEKNGKELHEANEEKVRKKEESVRNLDRMGWRV